MKVDTLFLGSYVLVAAMGCGDAGDQHGHVGHSALALVQSPAAVQYHFAMSGPAQITTHGTTTRYGTPTETLVQFTGTSAVIAWQVVGSPQEMVGMPASPHLHDELARQYFIDVGIPEGELGDLHHFVGYKGVTHLNAPGKDPPDETIGYSTSFLRRVSGYDAVDSVASVRLNSAAQPIALTIVWPPAPNAVVLQQADALAAALQSGWQSKQRVEVSPDVSGRSVILHHSMRDAAQLEWGAFIRITLNGAMPTFRDFDLDGNEVHLYQKGPAQDSPSVKPVPMKQ